MPLALFGLDRVKEAGCQTNMGLFSMGIVTFDDQFLHQLQDVYYAENQITKALPKMVD